MQIFGLTIDGHGHNVLAQSEQAKQDQTGLDSPEVILLSLSCVCLTCLSHVSVPQDVAILITDGQANVEQDQVNRETQLIKDQGVELFVVGITNEVDQAELRRIASDPDSTHVFEVGSGSLGHSGWGVGGCLIPAL